MSCCCGLKYLLTRRLNQDALENTFAIIRTKCGSNVDASCHQFEAAVRHLLLGQLFKTTAASNCAEDADSFLAALPVDSGYISNLGSSATAHIIDDVVTAPSDSPSPLGTSCTTMFAGWLASKFLRGHTCTSGEKCILLEEDATLQDNSQLLILYSVKNPDNNDFGKLCVPAPGFAAFVGACEETFKANIGNYLIITGIKAELCDVLDRTVTKTLALCSSTVYKDIFLLFLGVRLFWHARQRNVELRNATLQRKF